jgi:hypothetical protein
MRRWSRKLIGMEERSEGGGRSEVEAVGIGWSYFGGVGFTKR